EYYRPMLEAIDAMIERGTISVEDKKLFLLTDDVDEAMQFIQSYIRDNYQVKPRKRLWWLFEKR
ncbi:MAG: hypothetical protein ACKPIC_11485, partial [Microcystis panniformis]